MFPQPTTDEIAAALSEIRSRPDLKRVVDWLIEAVRALSCQDRDAKIKELEQRVCPTCGGFNVIDGQLAGGAVFPAACPDCPPNSLQSGKEWCPRCHSEVKAHMYTTCQASRGFTPHEWHDIP